MRRGRKDKPELYFLQRGGHIKIGVAVDVEQRLRTFETASAIPIYVIGIVKDGDYALETSLHRKFDFCHVSNEGAGSEWFLPHPELLFEIFILTGKFPRFNIRLVLSLLRAVL